MAEPEQTVTLPVIVPGCAGNGFKVTASVCATEEPHELLAVMETLPLDEPAVVVIVLVDEVPVHPDGSVHV